MKVRDEKVISFLSSYFEKYSFYQAKDELDTPVKVLPLEMTLSFLILAQSSTKPY